MGDYLQIRLRNAVLSSTVPEELGASIHRKIGLGAFDGRKSPRAHFSGTKAYFGLFVALGLTTASLGPTLMGLAKQTGVGLGVISFVFAARSFGYMAGAWCCGRFLDRWPGNRLMAITVLAMSIAMAFTPATTSFWALMSISILLGLTEGGVDVGANTLIIRAHAGQTGSYLNALHFFYGLGALSAPLVVASSYLLRGDSRASYWLMAVLIMPLALWLSRTPGPIGPGEQASGENGSTSFGLVILISLFFFLYTGAEVSFGGWIFTYAVTVKLGSAASASYLTSAFWGALTLGRLLAIPLAKYLRKQTILFFGLAASLMCLALMLWDAYSPTVIFAGTVGLGLSMAALFPTMFALAEGRLNITGRTSAYFVIGASIGTKVLSLSVGQLFVSAGPASLLYACWLALAGATVALWCTVRIRSTQF